jgi:hypothetical protein
LLEENGDLVGRYGLATPGLSETLFDGCPLVIIGMIELTLSSFQGKQHLDGVFLPLSGPGQHTLDYLFHLISCHTTRSFASFMKAIDSLASR